MKFPVSIGDGRVLAQPQFPASIFEGPALHQWLVRLCADDAVEFEPASKGSWQLSSAAQVLAYGGEPMAAMVWGPEAATRGKEAGTGVYFYVIEDVRYDDDSLGESRDALPDWADTAYSYLETRGWNRTGTHVLENKDVTVVWHPPVNVCKMCNNFLACSLKNVW